VKKVSISLKELEYYLTTLLDPQKMEDSSPNGIQVAHTGSITRIATAVTASIETIEKAIALGVEALIVHHGIFRKNDPYPIVATNYRKIKLLIEHNIALLAYHLPLDAHRELGNNCKAAYDLGLRNLKPFAEFHKIPIGVIGLCDSLPFETVQQRVEKYYGRPASAVKVKDPIASVAIVSGAGERFLVAAAQAQADCLITGRVDEPVWDSAHEEGISFLSLGHYATETVGPKALAAHLKQIFAVQCMFIETKNPF
jgi:dinuclear metal center YbgI/SA1388 family protein